MNNAVKKSYRILNSIGLVLMEQHEHYHCRSNGADRTDGTSSTHCNVLPRERLNVSQRQTHLQLYPTYHNQVLDVHQQSGWFILCVLTFSFLPSNNRYKLECLDGVKNVVSNAVFARRLVKFASKTSLISLKSAVKAHLFTVWHICDSCCNILA